MLRVGATVALVFIGCQTPPSPPPTAPEPAPASSSGTAATIPVDREGPPSGGCAGAVASTRSGQAALQQAAEAADPDEKLRLTLHSLDAYRRAAPGWRECAGQGGAASEAKSRYFLADALHDVVRLEMALNAFDRTQYAAPTAAEIDAAVEAAKDVHSGTFVDKTARFVDDLNAARRELASARADGGQRP